MPRNANTLALKYRLRFNKLKEVTRFYTESIVDSL